MLATIKIFVTDPKQWSAISFAMQHCGLLLDLKWNQSDNTLDVAFFIAQVQETFPVFQFSLLKFLSFLNGTFHFLIFIWLLLHLVRFCFPFSCIFLFLSVPERHRTLILQLSCFQLQSFSTCERWRSKRIAYFMAIAENVKVESFSFDRCCHKDLLRALCKFAVLALPMKERKKLQIIAELNPSEWTYIELQIWDTTKWDCAINGHKNDGDAIASS